MLRLGTLLLLCGSVFANELTINKIEDAAKAGQFTNIKIGNIQVPAGQTLHLKGLKAGTKIDFVGKVTFGFKQWEGPLIKIEGKGITVTGSPGHVIDCDGKRWWDGKGGNGGTTKPKFFAARLTDSSISNLNVKNLPVHGFSINSCQKLAITGVNIDVSSGDYANGAHNTDGFDVGSSSDIQIKNCNVKNQDDCLAINSGKNILFQGNTCSGGHGISIGSVGARKDNVVQGVIIKDNVVMKSTNGIRVKTVLNAVGSVSDVTFENIKLVDISKVGITVQGNYLNGGPKGEPTGGVPIRDLTIKNVYGNVLPQGTNILVWVKNASNWKWDDKITGGTKARPCQGFPNGTPKKC
ncbi:Polygalacturonase [Nesidiocoris tenuis]|uniref:endo-polygalacturonase n=1 Tax=Nesidiocoris tenuis TaxID=355587 RepID=A0ABN7AZN2_9HEMI|nr:Polygalacturonase [Nesidiocoris tenuis]